MRHMLTRCFVFCTTFVASFSTFTEKSEDELEEICRLNYLPSTILQLKEVQQEDSDGGDLSCQYGVFTLMPLPKGSSFGPFKSTLLSGDEDKTTTDQRCVLKVTVLL